VRLIVQPDAGFTPLVTALKQARKSVDVMIFRLDRPEIEEALAGAVARGVTVRALIAHTATRGERELRKLELRLLEAGVTVSRTADDLVRYHPKYAIVDAARLFVLGFNFTAIDVKSRSFGLEVRAKPFLKDALELFEADSNRQPVPPMSRDMIVSPVNARERLSTFIQAAKRELLIYDPKLSDPRIIRLLRERARNGVAIRVIGKVGKAGTDIPAQRLSKMRLHVRAIVRDRAAVFIGSQSLRRLELDKRRELGLIARDLRAARQVADIFEADWAKSAPAPSKEKEAAAVAQEAAAAG
jgi:phosphatidylserine/phosphatidylglycerophosphate/cardiolipin synthase-like enzyme